MLVFRNGQSDGDLADPEIRRSQVCAIRSGTPGKLEIELFARIIDAQPTEIARFQKVVEVEVGRKAVRLQAAIAAHIATNGAEILPDDQQFFSRRLWPIGIAGCTRVSRATSGGKQKRTGRSPSISHLTISL